MFNLQRSLAILLHRFVFKSNIDRKFLYWYIISYNISINYINKFIFLLQWKFSNYHALYTVNVNRYICINSNELKYQLKHYLCDTSIARGMPFCDKYSSVYCEKITFANYINVSSIYAYVNKNYYIWVTKLRTLVYIIMYLRIRYALNKLTATVFTLKK